MEMEVALTVEFGNRSARIHSQSLESRILGIAFGRPKRVSRYVLSTRKIFYDRVKCNGAARYGKYTKYMEAQAAW